MPILVFIYILKSAKFLYTKTLNKIKKEASKMEEFIVIMLLNFYYILKIKL